jgi:hypothetical protein
MKSHQGNECQGRNDSCCNRSSVIRQRIDEFHSTASKLENKEKQYFWGKKVKLKTQMINNIECEM